MGENVLIFSGAYEADLLRQMLDIVLLETAYSLARTEYDVP